MAHTAVPGVRSGVRPAVASPVISSVVGVLGRDGHLPLLCQPSGRLTVPEGGILSQQCL